MASKSEMGRLLDLALEAGVDYRVAQDSVENSILKLYVDKFGKQEDVIISVDFHKDLVLIMKDNQNLISKEFELIVKETVRLELLDLIEKRRKIRSSKNDDKKKLHGVLSIPWQKIGDWFFWGYHIYYVLIVSFWLWFNWQDRSWTKIGIGDLISIRNWMIGLVLVVPILIMWFVYKKKIIGSQLVRLICFLELPIVFIGLVFGMVWVDAIFIWRLIGVSILMLSVMFYFRLFGKDWMVNLVKWKLGMMIISMLCLVLVSGYILVWISFFVPGLVYGYWRNVIMDLRLEEISYLGIWGVIEKSVWLGLVLLIFGLLMLILVIFLGIVNKIFREFSRLLNVVNQTGLEYRRLILGLGFWVVMGIVVGVLYQTNYGSLSEEMMSFDRAVIYEQKQEVAKRLVDREAEIKQIIKDTNQSNRRYLFKLNSAPMIDFYQEMMDLNDSNQLLEFVNASFMIWSSPMVYRGPSDVGLMADVFVELFGYEYYDNTIEGNNSQVELVRRNIRVLSSGDSWVSVGVEDEFRNKSTQEQEVIYEFSLPEDAVITDLKLGDALQFSGIVAPRGAARETYEQQIQRRRDPALLEQTGLRQYRLRVYPVPGKNDLETLGGRNQRVWFSYLTKSKSGSVEMPIYTKQSNLDIVKASLSSDINGNKGNIQIADRTVSISKESNCKSWQENVSIWTDFENFELSARLGSLDNFRAEVGDIQCEDGKWKMMEMLKGRRVAIMYDSSWSNRNNALLNDLKRELSKSNNWIDQNNVYWFTFNNLISAGTRLDSGNANELLDVVYFGVKDMGKVLGSFDTRGYDWVIIVTNNDNWNISKNNLPNRFGVKLDVLHDKGIPSYSNDILKFLLKSDGDVFDNWDDLVDNYRAYLTETRIGNEKLKIYGDSAVLYSQIPSLESVTWDVRMIANLEMNLYANQSNLSLGSRWVVNRYLVDVFGDNDGDLSVMNRLYDKLNFMANDARVVTPVSSMLALVNASQIEELKRNMKSNLRFEDGFSMNIPVVRPTILNTREMPFSGGMMSSGMWGGMIGSSMTLNESLDSQRDKSAVVVDPLSNVFVMNSGFIILLTLPMLGVMMFIGVKWIVSLRRRK